MFFSGVYSHSRSFHPGTPQGGILILFLFNILMHWLLTSLPDISVTTITCYGNDICVYSTSPRDTQPVLASLISLWLALTVALLFSQIRAECLLAASPPQGLSHFTIGKTNTIQT